MNVIERPWVQLLTLMLEDFSIMLQSSDFTPFLLAIG